MRNRFCWKPPGDTRRNIDTGPSNAGRPVGSERGVLPGIPPSGSDRVHRWCPAETLGSLWRGDTRTSRRWQQRKNIHRPRRKDTENWHLDGAASRPPRDWKIEWEFHGTHAPVQLWRARSFPPDTRASLHLEGRLRQLWPSAEVQIPFPETRWTRPPRSAPGD